MAYFCQLSLLKAMRRTGQEAAYTKLSKTDVELGGKEGGRISHQAEKKLDERVAIVERKWSGDGKERKEVNDFI